MKSRLLSLLAVMAAFGSTGPAIAQTVAWGTSVSAGPLGYYSDGTAAGGALTWTIGYFINGFEPDELNFFDWAANYVEVDRDTEQDFGGLIAVPGYEADVGPAAAGKQAYIFVYNDLGAIGTDQGEVLLFKEEGFLFPAVPLSGTFDIEDNPNSTVDDDLVVIWGQVERDRDAPGGLVIGAGVFSDQLDDTTTNGWEGQTATWEVIPEPSIALLCFSSLLLACRRRRPR